MPDRLPHAPEDTRQLAARPEGEGYDTQVAAFFGEQVAPEEEHDTQIESADLGRTARDRSRDRAEELRRKSRIVGR